MMTSVVDKYYRRLIQNIDNVRMKFDISTLLVKSKEHDSKIENNETNISENLSLIGDNKSNISENLKLINSKSDIIENNETNISENLSLIEDNENNISENLKLINTKSDIIEHNKNNIAVNSKLMNTKSYIIDNNKNNITNNYNITQIIKKKSEFNTSLIDNNIENLKSIKNDIENYYKLKDIIIFDIIKTNIAEHINKSLPKFTIIQSSLNNNFKKDCYLEFFSSILTFFNKHYINIGFFHMLLEFFDDENELFKSIKLPIIGMFQNTAF